MVRDIDGDMGQIQSPKDSAIFKNLEQDVKALAAMCTKVKHRHFEK